MDFVAELTRVLGSINVWLYTYYLVALLIIVGVFYSFKLGFVQLRLFAESVRVIAEKESDGKKHVEYISPFQALMISTASRVGIGNIAGIAFAITTGGPGAIFWM